MMEAFGVIIGHNKRQGMSPVPHLLGLVTDMSEVAESHEITLRTCPNTQARAAEMLSAFLSVVSLAYQAYGALSTANSSCCCVHGRHYAHASSGFRLGIWVQRDSQVFVSSDDVPENVVETRAPRRLHQFARAVGSRAARALRQLLLSATCLCLG